MLKEGMFIQDRYEIISKIGSKKVPYAIMQFRGK